MYGTLLVTGVCAGGHSYARKGDMEEKQPSKTNTGSTFSAVIVVSSADTLHPEPDSGR